MKFLFIATALIGLISIDVKNANAQGLHFNAGGVHIDIGRPHTNLWNGWGGWGGHAHWHNTTHQDYHPGRIVPHYNHFDYVPGHFHTHSTGHWDLHY
jgi:hypothetical protein